MLSLVTAAEYQHHFDTHSRDRELALLRSIRERELSLEARAAELARVAFAASRAPRRARLTWPRPIGAHFSEAAACPAA